VVGPIPIGVPGAGELEPFVSPDMKLDASREGGGSVGKTLGS